jgi:hypothetical protein
MITIFLNLVFLTEHIEVELLGGTSKNDISVKCMPFPKQGDGSKDEFV